MKTITANEFVDSLRRGECEFENIQIVGCVNIGEANIEKFHLIHVIFDSAITGQATIGEILISSQVCRYWSNIPMTYAGSLIKDMANNLPI
jgi:hypothetical protein